MMKIFLQFGDFADGQQLIASIPTPGIHGCRRSREGVERSIASPTFRRTAVERGR